MGGPYVTCPKCGGLFAAGGGHFCRGFPAPNTSCECASLRARLAEVSNDLREAHDEINTLLAKLEALNGVSHELSEVKAENEVLKAALRETKRNDA